MTGKPKGELRLRILGELLRGNGYAPAIQKAAGGTSRRSVEITIERLARDGLAGKIARAQWAITEAGRAYARKAREWMTEGEEMSVKERKSGHAHPKHQKMRMRDLMDHLRRPLPHGHGHITTRGEMNRWSSHELLTAHEEAHEEGR